MKNVRRSFWSYAGYGLWCLISFGNFTLTHTQTPWSYFWVFIGLVSLAMLGRLISKPYYLEIRGPRLIINRDFFRQDFVEIDDIEKVDLQDGPFSNSHIRLKDHKLGLDFNYYLANTNDFNRLTDSLELKVE